MKLYTNASSPKCKKVHAVQEHLGLEIERIYLDLGSPDLRSDDFLAMNPNGKIPVLTAGPELTLWESNPIMAYLASVVDSPLWPSSPLRYSVMQWMSWEACHFGPAVIRLIRQHIFAPIQGEDPNEEDIAAGLLEFRRLAAIADTQLRAHRFLVGDTPTLADFSVGIWMSYEHSCQLPIAECSSLEAWWDRVRELPGGDALMRST